MPFRRHADFEILLTLNMRNFWLSIRLVGLPVRHYGKIDRRLLEPKCFWSVTARQSEDGKEENDGQHKFNDAEPLVFNVDSTA